MTRSFAAALLVTAAGLLPVLLLGAHAPGIGPDLGVGSQAIGTMVGAFFGFTGLVSVQSGNASERRGWQWGIRTSAILLTAALLAPAVAPHLMTFALALIFLGSLGFALSVPASSLALTHQAPERLVATFFGLRQATVLIAAMASGVSVGFAEKIGWRGVFVAFTVVPILSALVVPKSSSGTTLRDRWHSPRPSKPVAKDSTRVSDSSPVSDVRALAFITIGGGIATVAGPSLTAFLVLDLVDRGFTAAQAGSVLTVAAGVGIVVRIAAGLTIDRTSSTGFAPMLLLIGLGGVGFVGLWLGPEELLVLSATLAYAAGWGWSGVFYYVLVAHFPRTPGRATGIAQLGVTAGAALGPAGFGWVAAAAGYRVVWGAIALCVGIGVALLGVAGRRLTRTAIARSPSHEAADDSVPDRGAR